MDAIVMAAGMGNRLRPLTKNMPKPLMPLMGRPIVEHIIRLLVANGFSSIGVKLHYRWAQIIESLGDGGHLGADLFFRVETPLLGTAQGVKRFARELNGTFCTIASDIATDVNIRRLVERHRRAGAVASIGLTRVTDVSRYGVVVTDESGRIRQFQEKPKPAEAISDLVNTGIYILEPEVLQYVEEDPDYDFGKNLFPKLASMGAPLFGFPVDGYWNDIGNPRDYVAASAAAAAGALKLPSVGKGFATEEALPKPPIVGHSAVSLDECVLWPGVRVSGQGYLRRCIVMESCTLQGDSIEESIYLGGSERRWVPLSA